MIAVGQVWYTPVIPVLGGQKQEDLLEFSGLAWATG